MSNHELLDALNRLDQLFSNESRWVQGALARSERKNMVKPTSRRAVCWCIEGGIRKLFKHYDEKESIRKTLEAVVPEGIYPFGILEGFNDHPQRQFSEVKRLIADARARIEATL